MEFTIDQAATTATGQIAAVREGAVELRRQAAESKSSLPAVTADLLEALADRAEQITDALPSPRAAVVDENVPGWAHAVTLASLVCQVAAGEAPKLNLPRFRCETHLCGECAGCRARGVVDKLGEQEAELARLRRVIARVAQEVASV